MSLMNFAVIYLRLLRFAEINIFLFLFFYLCLSYNNFALPPLPSLRPRKHETFRPHRTPAIPRPHPLSETVFLGWAMDQINIKTPNHKISSFLVFNGDYRLEIQSVMLEFSTALPL